MKKYFLILTLFLFCSESSLKDNYIAKLNGKIISVPEFRLLMKKNRAMIYNDFYQNYSAEDCTDFWTRSFNDEIPIEILKKKALDECIQIKVQQILAKQNNLVKSICYSDFLTNFEKEQQRRKNAYKSKQVIFGPIELTELGYYNYIISNLQIRLKNHLAANQFKVSDEQLKNYYLQTSNNHSDKSEKSSVKEIPFNSIPREFRSVYIDERYNALIDSLMDHTKIEINQHVYDLITSP